MKKDEFIIREKVADREYRMILTRGDETSEAIIRKAAERVRILYEKYRQKYIKTLEERDLLAMVALQLVTDLVRLEEQNDTTPVTQKIRRYIEELDGILSGN
ncbi:MAG: cell division protein ZapA [Tannerella sp.]|nr:cell division protein ZapA [Tannerella sp.]